MEKICKGCNSTLFDDNGCCLYCRRKYDNISVVDESVTAQLALARLAIEQDYDFVKALNICQGVLEQFPQNEEANWFALLAENYIVYIENGSHKYVPTFLYPERGALSESKYYHRLSVEGRQRADEIESKRQEVLNEWEKIKKEPYDVFISYKQHVGEGGTETETEEAELAQRLYTTLLSDKRTKGLKVFLDKFSLQKSNAGWEPHIYAAIKSAKMMIIVTSSIENMNARWVRNEWMRFLRYRKQGEKKELAVLCTSKKSVDPRYFPEMIIETKTQALFVQEYDDWTNNLCERAREAVEAASSFTLSEDHIGQKKREVIDKKKHKLNESTLSFESPKNAVELDLPKRLDQIDDDLQLGHKDSALKKLNQIKADQPDWHKNGQILTYDLAVKYNIRGKEALKQPANIEQIFETNLFKQIIENTTQTWAYFILDALYNYTLNSGRKLKSKEILEFVLPYQYPEKDDYLIKILQKAETEANSVIFDLILPWAKTDDRGEIIKICQTSFEKGDYSTASKYAYIILSDYEKGNPIAQDILLLSKYKCKNYKQLFDAADINIIDELKDILSYLSNEARCACGAVYDLDTQNGATISCAYCGTAIKVAKAQTDRINKLNEWNKDIIDGLALKFPKGFTGFYDAFLRMYPHAVQVERIKEIVELAKNHMAFDVALHYYEFLISSTKNKAPLYWSMMLCALHCANEEELYSKEFYKKVNGARIENNQYYSLAFQATASGSEFSEHIRSVNRTQQAKFDQYDADAAAEKKEAKRKAAEEARRKAAEAKEELKDKLNKGFLILLPIFSFLIGQVIQYWSYYIENRVFLLDRFYDNISRYVIFSASILGAVSTLFVILSARKLVSGYYADHPNFDAWFLVGITGVLAVGVPTIAGILLWLPAIVIFSLIKTEKFEFIPLICAITSCVVGQALSWLFYTKYNYVPILTEIMKWVERSDLDIFYMILSASIISAASTMLLSFIGYYFIENDEGGKAFGVLIPMLLLQSSIAVATSIAIFIVAMIVASYFYKSETSDVKIPQIAWVMFAMAASLIAFMPEVPIWVVLLITALDFLICKLFYKHEDQYQLQSFILFAIMGLGWVVWAMMHLDLMLPKLAQIKEMVDSGLVSEAYYEGAFHEARTVMIIGTVVILLLAVIGSVMDMSKVSPDVGTSFGGLTIPLMVIGSFIICCLIANAFIPLPESAPETYEKSFFLWTLIGSILTAMPGGVYQTIAFFWGGHEYI